MGPGPRWASEGRRAARYDELRAVQARADADRRRAFVEAGVDCRWRTGGPQRRSVDLCVPSGAWATDAPADGERVARREDRRAAGFHAEARAQRSHAVSAGGDRAS